MLRYAVLVIMLSLPLQARDSADDVLSQVYGTIGTACTQDADADTGGANRLGAFTRGRRYVVYCHDNAGAYVACECLQGGPSVDASSAVGILITQPVSLKFAGSSTHISCVPFVDNQYIDVCPLD